MDTYSVAEVARQLGTSVPRVRRALRALDVRPQQSARGERLGDDDIGRLVERLGSVPPGWSRAREDALVLAALNCRPLGLRSERAVARAARISPTAAGRAVDRLVADGLVAVERVRTVEGRAVDVDIFVVNRRSPEWSGLAAMVRAVALPECTGAARAPVRVPHRLWHHFWNADPATITLPGDSDYVAARLLQSTDPQAIAWSASNLDAESIRSAARVRGLDAPHRCLIHLLAAGAQPMSDSQFPVELAECLPPGTVETWLKIAPIVPPSAYLAGGTGLAIHLRHRMSRDLDFMFDSAVVINDLERGLATVGTLATTFKDEHSLNIVLDATRIQFLAAPGQLRLRPTTELAGIAVASIEDITAMKLKVVLDRGELRDYFDLMQIDRRSVPIEEGIDLFLQRYGIARDDQRIFMLLRSLAYLDDVADDPALPVEQSEIETFWHRRAPEIARSFSRM